MKSVLLLGVGNILYGDEGVGVHALRFLEERYEFPENVTLLDGGVMGKLLMAALLEHDFILILDAVLGGGAPGSLYRLEDEALRKSLGFHDSQHQVDLVDTLISCGMIGRRPEAVVIGMEPQDYRRMTDRLSDACAAALPLLIRHALAELEKLGVKPLAKTARAGPGQGT
ncbi:MAG: HyaD/HybD family hydrogenase maturation endopeptidase [Desulfovibrio sp.]|jgi:hydrogenase maturation protease|nr:HyaD/HybD family hydrogenase maturation endopeptidase [Desulfovibrio sp.]